MTVSQFQEGIWLSSVMKRFWEILASREAEICCFRRVGWQRGRSVAVLAQVIGRTASPFHKTSFVPAAKQIGADSLVFTAPENVDVVIDVQNIKPAVKTLDAKLRQQSHAVKNWSTKQTISSTYVHWRRLLKTTYQNSFWYKPSVTVWQPWW